MFFYKSEKTCFYVFYLQSNVFNIYGWTHFTKFCLWSSWFVAVIMEPHLISNQFPCEFHDKLFLRILYTISMVVSS